MTVIVTRPEPENQIWVESLRSAGIAPVSLPLIAIETTPTLAEQVSRLNLASYDAWMFVSPSAVRHFFSLANIATIIQRAPKLRFWATGTGSVNTLLDQDIPTHAIDAPPLGAKQFDSEALWQVVTPRIQQFSRVLILRGQDVDDETTGSGRAWLGDTLTKTGIQVDYLAVYRRTIPKWDMATQSLVVQLCQQNAIWLLTSSQSIKNFCQLGHGLNLGKPLAITTHERISQTAKQANFECLAQCTPRLADVIKCIKANKYPK